jgi:ubiquinol-cytochrome c reductase cytochrome c subunit
MEFSVRKLSTRRRHPLAGLVVLLLGLVVAGGAYAAVAPKPATAVEATANDVEAGKELFLVGCASCHGINATGIETKKGGNYGPSLIGVGAAAVDFQVGTGRMPMAQTAPQAPLKEREYNEEETKQLAAYVASLAPGPAIPDDRYTDLDAATVEDIREGGELFRSNCTACHNSVGAGGAMPDGKYAPSLVGVTPTHLAEAMITGPQQMPVFSDDVITPEDKRNIIAYVKRVQAEPNWGGIGGGNHGPVVDGMFIWLIGIGGLVIASIWIGAHGARAKKR